MAHEDINIDHLADLCRIELSAEEKELFRQQLDTMLTYLEQLNEVDIKDAKPTIHPVGVNNVLRPDIPLESFSPEIALQNAPKTKENQIVVPKIVE